MKSDLYYKECILLGKNNHSTIINMKEKRGYSSSIVLNDQTLWIVGGETGRRSRNRSNLFNTTEFITMDKNNTVHQSDGPELPFPISCHCMVQLNSSSIYLIGGETAINAQSKKTWILRDPMKNFTITEGPSMLDTNRFTATCGKMRLNDTDVIVVAGGYNHSNPKHFYQSVELLYPSGWREGNINSHFTLTNHSLVCKL